MLSRLAEAMYWMARYVERAENISRAIDVELQVMLDAPTGLRAEWQPLVSITGDVADFMKRYPKPTRGNVIEFLTFDDTYPNSICSCVAKARENARVLRSSITGDMWERVNTLHLFLCSREARAMAHESPFDFYSQIRGHTYDFHGIAYSTLSRDVGWNFLRLGLMLERADQTTRIMDVKYFMLLPQPEDVGSTLDDLLWMAVLSSVSGYEMYRRSFGRLQQDGMVRFLLLDRSFPRSVLYCLHAAEESLHAITGTSEGSFRTTSERKLGILRAALSYVSEKEILENGLHEYLDRLQNKLNDVGLMVAGDFFGKLDGDGESPSPQWSYIAQSMFQ